MDIKKKKKKEIYKERKEVIEIVVRINLSFGSFLSIKGMGNHKKDDSYYDNVKAIMDNNKA